LIRNGTAHVLLDETPVAICGDPLSRRGGFGGVESETCAPQSVTKERRVLVTARFRDRMKGFGKKSLCISAGYIKIHV
jgi:hypothetical protein